MQFDRVVVVLSTLFFFIFVEYIFPNATKFKNPFFRKYFLDDMLFLVMSSAIGAVMPLICFYYLHKYDIDYRTNFGFDFIKSMSWTWQFVGAFLLKDFLGYFMHRIAHWGPFWRFHRVHHESDYIDASMSFRVHPVNLIFISFRTPALVLVGFDFSVLPILGLMQFVHNVFIHTNIKLDFGFLNYFFISPYLHRIHHAAESKYHHNNYGVYLSIWDQMFGTFINQKNLEFELGVEGHTRRNFLLTNLVPFFPENFFAAKPQDGVTALVSSTEKANEELKSSV